MRNFKKIYLFVIICAVSNITAQDYHLSHYDVGSLYLNAATTGMYGTEAGDYKIYAAQRSQWRAIGVKPFMTSYLAFDKPYVIKDKNVGFGCYIINNNAGIGNFNTFTFMGSAAYDILGSKVKTVSSGATGNKHLLTVGLQLGIFYRSTNPNALNYDAQYTFDNGGAFDQALPSNEIYNRVNIARFDANYGLFYKYLESGKKAHPYAGFAMSHLTRPNESLTGSETRMPIKFSLYGGCDLKLDDKMDLTPRVLYMNQAKAFDFTSGFLFYYRVNDDDLKVMLGFDYRWKDACVIALGLKHEYYAFRFSYDINTSYLNNYTRGRGAWEVSLIYSGKHTKNKIK